MCTYRNRNTFLFSMFACLLSITANAQTSLYLPALFEDGKKEQELTPEATAQQWLDSHEEAGLVLVEKNSEGGFQGIPISGLKSMRYEFAQNDYHITLIFSEPLTKTTTIKEAREKFERIALNKLPLPGTTFPKGWNVTPRTAMSSMTKGVEILDIRDGNITLRIKAGFYAIYGRNEDVRVPADASLPAGSYFKIEKKFPLDLTIQAPISNK